MQKIIMGLSLCGIGLLAAAVDVQPPPVMTAAPAERPPAIDGRLDDPCWSNVTAVNVNRLVGTGGLAAVATLIKVTHDADWLYLGLRCEDEKGKPIAAERRGRNNNGATEDDSVEIFIDQPRTRHGRTKHDYFHFMLGAGGAKREQRVVGPTQFPSWSISWPSAVAVMDCAWQAEAAIPLYIFGNGPIGPLGFNVTRNKKTDPEQFITWAPLAGEHRAAYYNPEAFGILQGLTGLPVRRQCAPLVERAYNVALFRERAAGYAYAFDVTLANPGGLAGEAVVVVEDQELATSLNTRHTFNIKVPAEGLTNYTFEIPAANPVERRVRLAMADEQSRDEAWIEVAGASVLQSMTAYPDLNYYSGETRGRLTIGTVFTDAGFAERKLQVALRITRTDGSVFKEEKFDQIKNQGVIYEYDPAAWAPGSYMAAVSLQSAAGQELGRCQALIRIEPPPPPGITVTKVDQEQMCLLVNGRPFFPIGFLSLAGFGLEIVFNEKTGMVEQTNTVDRLAQAGFNYLMDWRHPASRTGMVRSRANKPWTAETDRLMMNDIASNIAWYVQAEKAGLYVSTPVLGHISVPHNYPSIIRKDQALLMEKLPGVIEKYRHVPNLMAIQGRDEISPEIFDEVLQHAAIMRQADPYHVIFATCRGIRPGFYDAYDILGVHAYWAPDSNPNRLASWVMGGAQSAKRRRRPVFATPQAQRLTYYRELTPDERRSGIYAPLVQGAKGLTFFAHPHPFEMVHPVTWRVLSYTAREINRLAPMLLNNPPPQNIVLTMNADPAADAAVPALPAPRSLFDPAAGSDATARGPGPDNMPLVQALIHDLEGAAPGDLILAVNTGPAPLKINYALSSLGPDSRVTGFFSQREYPVTGQSFSDVLEPFGVRVYAARGVARRRGAPVALGIQAAAGRVNALANRQYFTPQDRRVQMGGYEKKENEFIWSAVDDQAQILLDAKSAGKNMFKNSSFEEYALPGLPDHWIQTYIMRQYGQVFWGRQTNEAFDGSYSVRLRAESGRSWYHPTIAYRFWIAKAKGGSWEFDKDYVFSAYVKARRTNAVVRLSIIPDRLNEGYNENTGISRDFNIGPAWQRIEWPFRIVKKDAFVADYENLIAGIRVLPDNIQPKGEVWVDAVQLEAGTVATPYERDDYRAPAVDPKWLSDDVFRELE